MITVNDEFVSLSMKQISVLAEQTKRRGNIGVIYARMAKIPYGYKMVRFLKTMPSIALCGGAIRSLLEGEEPKDWDFYVPKKDMGEVVNMLKGYPSITIDKQNSRVVNATWLSVDDEDGKVSFTSLQFLAIRNDLPAFQQPLRFDLTPTLFSLRYDVAAKDYVLYHHIKAVPSVINRTMELYGYTEPFYTLGRIGRYTTYGYRLLSTESEMQELGRKINMQELPRPTEEETGEYTF